MPPLPPHDHFEFNSPTEMLRRAAYLVQLGCGIVAIVVTFVAVFTGQPLLLVPAVASAIVAALGYFLRRRITPAGAIADEGDWFAEIESEPPQLANFKEMVRQWDQLEQRRGFPDFDPWAVQMLRNDIKAVLKQDPTLERFVSRRGRW